MELAEVPWGILLMLPSRSVALLAKATLVAPANFRDKPIVCLVRLKTTREIHLVDLFTIEDAEKRLCGYTVLESRYDPVDREGAASGLPAGLFEFEGIGLEWGCWLLPRSIITPFFWHWSTTWKERLGRYDLTRSWGTNGTKRRVEWCIMGNI